MQFIRGWKHTLFVPLLAMGLFVTPQDAEARNRHGKHQYRADTRYDYRPYQGTRYSNGDVYYRNNSAYRYDRYRNDGYYGYPETRSAGKSAAIIGGSAAAGAAVGAITGGGKGAIIGGAVGAVGGLIYDRATRNNDSYRRW